jgi:hypothetical protein
MSLRLYYRIVFALAQHHKYQTSEIEGLMPYERDVYFSMLIDFIESQKES